MKKPDSFLLKPHGEIPGPLAEDMLALNPWWRGGPAHPAPPFRRWAFTKIRHLLANGLTPAVALRGPRRVGKTLLMRQVIGQLLAEGMAPTRILYVSFDEIQSAKGVLDPILAIARWFESDILGKSFNQASIDGQPAYIFLDEVQNLDAWSPQIKHLVDNHQLRMLLTGSSSLRIEAGRDSLAGRITTVEMGPLLLREIAALAHGMICDSLWGDNAVHMLTIRDFWTNALTKSKKEAEIRNVAFKSFSERGAYPDAHVASPSWPELAEHLNETVIRRAIQHDLRMGPKGQKRDENLLDEVFRLCCRYAGQAAGQSVFVPEIQQALRADIGWSRVLAYLRFMDGTLLLRLIKPLEIRLKRQKSPAKICLCDHALRASWLGEIIPLDPAGLSGNLHLAGLAGHLAESVLGYFLASIPNLDVAYFPARGIEPEVDFVLTIGTQRIPIEVKYRRRIDPFEDTRSLRFFLEKTVYNAPFGILVTLDDDVTVLDPRIIPISLSSFLWLR